MSLREEPAASPPRALSWLLVAATCFAGYLAFRLLRESQLAPGFLLASFALLTAVLAVAAARRSTDKGTLRSPVRFVPHWFLMAVLVAAAVGMTAAILLV